MLIPTAAVMFLLFAGTAAAGVMVRLLGDRSQRIRGNLRRTYSNEASPQWLRNALPLVPIWAPASFMMGLLALTPRSAALILLVPVFALIEVGLVLAYRVPAPFLPGWLRDEIKRGVTPVARPDRLDWLLFWVVFPVMIGGDFALILYVAFHG